MSFSIDFLMFNVMLTFSGHFIVIKFSNIKAIFSIGKKRNCCKSRIYKYKLNIAYLKSPNFSIDYKICQYKYDLQNFYYFCCTKTKYSINN